MSSIFLFEIASQRSQWLSMRQAAISSNIANANTPGYTAMDVKPFETVLHNARLEVAQSDPDHLSEPGRKLASVEHEEEANWHVFDSGNSVSLENEMVKAGEVNSAFALNNSVIKAFHRMLLTSAKG
jgi:flagellar basal-body rod protein FlgB